MRRAIINILAANDPVLVWCLKMEVRERGEIAFMEIHKGPHGEEVFAGPNPSELTSLEGRIRDHLPAGWTEQELMTAAHYWAEGRDLGYRQGELAGRTMRRPTCNGEAP